MGLKTNQVFGDQEPDWGQTLKSGAAELAKQPLTRPPQQQSEPLNCPRCGSANTKFCYYNNYSKSQPRHFCKSCKRYWTKGGTLRDVPAGGGRKNKHSKTSKTATTTTATITTAPANPEPQQRHFQNLISITTDQETKSHILYQALISSSSPSLHKTTDGISICATRKPFLESNSTINSAGSNASAPQNPNTEFAFSNLTSMIDPTSYQSSYDHTNHYAKNLDSMKESTIAALHIPKSSSAPWPVLDTSSATDFPNHWIWNEIDALSNSADPSMAWDDVDAGTRHLENQF